MDTLIRYFEDALLASGLAVLDLDIAYRLAPSRWPTARGASHCWLQHGPRLIDHARRHAPHLMQVRFAECERPVMVAANARERLGERLHWLTGYAVVDLAEQVPDRPEPTPAELSAVAANAAVRAQRADAALERLAILAARIDAWGRNPGGYECLDHAPVQTEIAGTLRETYRQAAAGGAPPTGKPSWTLYPAVSA